MAAPRQQQLLLMVLKGWILWLGLIACSEGSEGQGKSSRGEGQGACGCSAANRASGGEAAARKYSLEANVLQQPKRGPESAQLRGGSSQVSEAKRRHGVGHRVYQRSSSI